jgi:hypothetical protein
MVTSDQVLNQAITAYLNSVVPGFYQQQADQMVPYLVSYIDAALHANGFAITKVTPAPVTIKLPALPGPFPAKAILKSGEKGDDYV